MRQVSILIPAHNEETVIGPTIESLVKIAPVADIYVVSDGSTDKTVEKALEYTSNVLDLRPNRGKAGAMNAAIKHFNLSNRYNYILPMDADTRIDLYFLVHALPILEADLMHRVACVVGKVVGTHTNWITNFRLWEYEVAQTIHKKAQAIENAIIVNPGCSTLYRSEIFNKINFPEGTLTEDMEFTFMIHRQNLGRIVFNERAKVLTQDPQTLQDMVKQLNRWYTGFWQCLVRHNVPWGGQMLDLELAVLATESLFNSLLVLTLFFLVPLALLANPFLLLFPLGIDLALFLIPSMLLTAIRHKNWEIFRLVPAFYFLRIVSSLILMRSFVSVVLGIDFKMKWNKVRRYAVAPLAN